MKDGHTIAVIIPALDEADAIAQVIDEIPAWVDQTIVCDNGSSDGTAQVAEAAGACVVHEPRRGYGAACLRALAALASPDIVVFLDGDRSDFPAQMDRLIEPITQHSAELVIGSRNLQRAEHGALNLPQRFGNALASFLLRRIWNQPCSDLGPFRAIRFDALQALRMDDLSYGWTVQMQARAMKQSMRIVKAPVAYRRRIGRSKISGTIRGVLGAGSIILCTIAREALAPAAAPFRRQHLIIFARYPEPGTTKTRLIPHLGEDGAAEIQKRMNRHTFKLARRWARQPGCSIEVRFTGGSSLAMSTAFGDDLTFREQGPGDLGQRLSHAFEQSDTKAHDATIAIGTDCPELDVRTLDTAFEALHRSELVLGPASDGGYYLIGMHRHHPAIFTGIDWSTSHVLPQTRHVIKQLQLTCTELPIKHDIDEPDDLRHLDGITLHHQPLGPRVSIIIPALNEADALAELLPGLCDDAGTQVIVVDGGSTDGTADIARAHGAVVLTSSRGRALQMNCGAAHARGDALLFLHADTRLPFGWQEHVARAMNDPGVVAGAFCLAFDRNQLALRIIEAGANLRSRVHSLPYGDQAIFLRRETFEQLGGFAELPVMEDYQLIQRLRKLGRIRIAPAAAITSARRCRTRGIWRTTALHQAMILGWYAGISPQRLAHWHGGSPDSTSRAPDPCGSNHTSQTMQQDAHGCAHKKRHA